MRSIAYDRLVRLQLGSREQPIAWDDRISDRPARSLRTMTLYLKDTSLRTFETFEASDRAFPALRALTIGAMWMIEDGAAQLGRLPSRLSCVRFDTSLPIPEIAARWSQMLSRADFYSSMAEALADRLDCAFAAMSA